MKFRDFFRGENLIFIAEIGINHNGKIDEALAMIDSAADAGAQAVKFQTFNPDAMYSRYGASLLKGGTEGSPDRSLIEFFASLTLKEDDYRRLFKKAEERGILMFSSAFDGESVDMLEKTGVRAYKAASSEVTNIMLLKKIAQTGKPVLLSTGISHESEIEKAISVLRDYGTPDITLLHCVSLYPLPPESVNLNRIVSLRERFGLDVGFSDHSPDHGAVQGAVALGARIFEKHFRLSSMHSCPDAAVSLEPDSFRQMIDIAKGTFVMMGDGRISYGFSEKDVAKSARRSLYAKRDLSRGTVLEITDIVCKRPEVGIPAHEFETVIGKTLNTDVNEDYLLRMEYFE